MDRKEVWVRFAAAALSGLLAHPENDLEEKLCEKWVVERSSDIADKMLELYDVECEMQEG